MNARATAEKDRVNINVKTCQGNTNVHVVPAIGWETMATRALITMNAQLNRRGAVKSVPIHQEGKHLLYVMGYS